MHVKTSGYIGICLILLKWLPASAYFWIAFIFTLVFNATSFPPRWCTSCLQIIFQSGNHLIFGNYRGISIMESLAKLYDYVLNWRPVCWCQVSKAQSGAQRGRNCKEHILSLMLLMDYCWSKKERKVIHSFCWFQQSVQMLEQKWLLQNHVACNPGCLLLYKDGA